MQTEPTTTTRLATAAGVADFLAVSTRTVARMVAAGVITPIRIRPSVVRYDLAQVERAVMESGVGRGR